MYLLNHLLVGVAPKNADGRMFAVQLPKPDAASTHRSWKIMVQLPGFEPGSPTWQAGIITKLYYNCTD